MPEYDADGRWIDDGTRTQAGWAERFEAELYAYEREHERMTGLEVDLDELERHVEQWQARAGRARVG